MAGAEARLDEAGVSLWLTDWKIDAGAAWTGRRIMAVVGGAMAGHLDFFVHPDGQAVEVVMLEVYPRYQRRNLASVMMDALYAAYPTSWIEHGGRTPVGTLWWDRYRDPAPERNVHNRPPAEWAPYFEPLIVTARKTINAYENRYHGVDGHRDEVYRYGEPMEEEARQCAAAFREPELQGPDPGLDELYGGTRLFLPGGLLGIVHDSSIDATERATMVLDHIGLGGLPPGSAWNTTERSAFEDLAHEQLLRDDVHRPSTHMTFHILPVAGQAPPLHEVKATWVDFINSPGIEVKLSGMSWRSSELPWVTHRAVFDPPVDAAIAPQYVLEACPAYLARYDEFGDLRPGQGLRRADSPAPYEDRAVEIHSMADKLQQGVAARAADRSPASSGRPAPSGQQEEHHRQQHRQPPPRIR